MKRIIAEVSILIFILLPNCVIHSQSRSVLDASYFMSDNYVAPLKAGKGFHINDLFKQTNFCFTTESTNKSNLVQQQTSPKFSCKAYYTQTENEFNEFRSTGTSGKVNYLNLFSVGASDRYKFSSRNSTQVRRLIIVANVDYGNFEYENDLTLTPEAQSYITNEKYEDFISLYGTHYVTGIKKEANIFIVISESSNKITSKTANSSQIDFGASIPLYGVETTLSLVEKNQANTFLGATDLSLIVEINGVKSVDHTLFTSINNYLNGSESDKYSSIINVVNSTLNNFTNPYQGIVTQYYFAPFTLKGVQNIYWDLKKENQLVEINQNVLRLSMAKNIIDDLISNGTNDVLNTYDSFFEDSQFNNKDEYRNKLTLTYNKILPNLKQYQSELNTLYTSLETYYKKCSSTSCLNTTTCCDFTYTKDKINVLIPKIESSAAQLNDVFKTAIEMRDNYESIPDCQKNNVGYVTIVNKSSNPYRIYINGNYQYDILGKAVGKIEIKTGTTNIKAEQRSGYAFYATINNRTVIINNPCDEATIDIGYED